MASNNSAPQEPLQASKEGPVLVACDNSEAALRLVEFVARTVNKNTPVELLHVQPKYHSAVPGSFGGAAFSVENLDRINKELELESCLFLHNKLAPVLQAAGIQAKTVLLRHSSDGADAIGSAICKHAENVKASMLVLTKTSKSMLTRVFAGSVCRYIVNHARTPLLIC